VEVDAFCRETRAFLRGKGLASDVFPVEMLLRESLNNAMIHGNCSDSRKCIRAEVRIEGDWILLNVSDEGDGFSCEEAMKRPSNPEATGGRGLEIYSLYAQRISFNSKGNQVCLWRAITGGCEK
jgi:anti-sigma regulatory factor (Ser/Thr protein kinase)